MNIKGAFNGRGSRNRASMIAQEAEDSGLRRDWAIFISVVFLFNFGFAVYNGVFLNFFRDTLQAGALDVGRLESLREVPGLLAAVTAGLLVSLAETRVAAIGLVICAAGMTINGFQHSIIDLTISTVFWSIGFHLYSTVSGVITMSLAKGKEGGRHLGRMRSVASSATIGGLACAAAGSLLLPEKAYLPYFILTGVCIGTSGLLCLALSHHASGGKRQSFVLKRRYWLYYWLTFLDGCRRMIFSIFATYTLILVYGQSLKAMLIIYLVNALLIAATATKIGKLFDRLGEKIPLTVYAASIAIIFTGYATIRSLPILIGLYIVDNMVFSFSVGLTTYVHRIAEGNDFVPSLAMGVTMNHIAAVSAPFLGALLWTRLGNYQAPFWIGVILAVIQLVSSKWLPAGRRAPEEPVPA